jgi:hypothetical protein
LPTLKDHFPIAAPQQDGNLFYKSTRAPRIPAKAPAPSFAGVAAAPVGEVDGTPVIGPVIDGVGGPPIVSV